MRSLSLLLFFLALQASQSCRPKRNCKTCEPVELLQLDKDFEVSVVPTASAITKENGCAETTVTCEVPDPDILLWMTFNEAIPHPMISTSNSISASLLCSPQGLWVYTYQGDSINVTSIDCSY